VGQRIRTSRVERLAIRLCWRRGRPPTDFELLRAVYERHDADWASSDERETRIFLPIDIPAIADDLGINGDMVFGRLYHDLNQKHQQREPEKPSIVFFTPVAGTEANCVNWPLLVGVPPSAWSSLPPEATAREVPARLQRLLSLSVVGTARAAARLARRTAGTPLGAPRDLM
jgi:hypothetical protein